ARPHLALLGRLGASIAPEFRHRISFSKPTITVSKKKLIWGQSVRVTCSINTEHSGGTFTLKHQTRDVQTSTSNPATFTLSSVTFDNEGRYHCVYQKVLSGQSFSSPQSDSIRLQVTGESFNYERLCTVCAYTRKTSYLFVFPPVVLPEPSLCCFLLIKDWGHRLYWTVELFDLQYDYFVLNNA
uniref:Ig-like domain-containing protein n=1 Tax=Neogobius melanostomus TaxID=47308 RepID=A0A8C6SCQ7_9GOBI